MRRYASLFAILLLLCTSFLAGCSSNCNPNEVGLQPFWYSRERAPRVVPTSWGVVQPNAPSVVSVPRPTGVTFAGDPCQPGSTVSVPLGTTYTPGHSFQAAPAR